MKTYNKRIGFLISSESLKAVGGIGQFAKSFCETMFKYNIKVDLILDKKPIHQDFVDQIKANVVYPDTSLSYTEHGKIFMYEDSYCLERMINFRDCIIKALANNLYDVFVCNTHEAVQVAMTLGLEDYIQMIGYTHHEHQIYKTAISPFLDCANTMMRKQISLPGLYVGTQSLFNKAELTNQNVDAYHLPIPLPDSEILLESDNHREGILFIGRWEPRKNPQLFIDLIEKTKLPAYVLTSANGKKKFVAALSKLGVTYDVQVGLTGKEKIDFITKCRVAFNPSLMESYGIAFLEQQIQMPTVALDDKVWVSAFNQDRFFTCNKRNMAEVVTELYNKYPTAKSWYQDKPIDYFIQQENKIFSKWNQCFLEFEIKKSNSNTAKINEETTIRYAEFVEKLDRKVLCIDDIRSAIANKHKFRVIYTDQDTWLTKDPRFEPKDTATSLFEGL
jgi:hypothetical protein